MAISQSQKNGVLKTTNPQSSRLAGFTDTTLEDASAWTTADGVKQDRGWAYADGSTLVNASGKYNGYLARTGSLVLPNGPFRTKEVDITTTGTGWTQTYAKAIAYSDNAGEWRLRFNIRGGMSSAARTGVTITFSGITFEELQETGASPLGTNSVSVNQAFTSGNTVVLGHSSGTTTGYMVSGDVQLTSKPTWADANLESYPVVQLYDSVAAGALGLPEATADVSGIVTRNQVTEAGRNYIINGAMEFNQRGPDSASATSRYVLDRWKANASGATILGSLIEVSNVPFSNYMRLVASTADDNWGWFQNIEHPKDFSNNTYTLSFEARSADGSVAGFDVEPSFVFGSDTNELLTTTSIPLTTSFVKHTVTITTPDLSGKTIGDNDFFSIGFIQKLNQTGQFDLRKVKLEEGTIATKFTRAGGTYAGELALCQRYFYTPNTPGVGSATQNIGMGYALGVDRALITVNLPVYMRRYPTVSYSGAFRISNHVGGSAPLNVTSLVAFSGSNSSVILDVNKGTGTNLTAGSGVTLLRYLDSNATVGFSAEL